MRGGPSVQVTNVVVQTTPYKTVYLSHKFGLTTSSARVIGSGSALVLSGTGRSPAGGPGGVAVKGTWSKPGIRDVTNYLDSTAAPGRLPARDDLGDPGPARDADSTAGGRS